MIIIIISNVQRSSSKVTPSLSSSQQATVEIIVLYIYSAIELSEHYISTYNTNQHSVLSVQYYLVEHNHVTVP